MSIYTIIGIAVVLIFVAWMFFSNSQKPKRPGFTEGKSKFPLYDLGSMLNNITEKEKSEIESESIAELLEEKPEENEIKEEKKDTRDTKNNKTNTKNNKFDLKSAVIGANIIERKKS